MGFRDTALAPVVSGREDGTLPVVGDTGAVIGVDAQGRLLVAIDAQNIGTLAVDIDAQSINQLDIDIVAQSLSELANEQTINSSEGLATDSAQPTSDVPDPGTERVTLAPPTDDLWETQAIQLNIQDTGGGSEHSVDVQVEGSLVDLIGATSNGTSRLSYRESFWEVADVEQGPSAVSAQTAAPRGVRVSASQGLEFRYDNLSGAVNDQQRTYAAAFRRVRI